LQLKVRSELLKEHLHQAQIPTRLQQQPRVEIKIDAQKLNGSFQSPRPIIVLGSAQLSNKVKY